MNKTQNGLLFISGATVAAIVLALASGAAHAQSLWDSVKDKVVDRVTDSVEKSVVDAIPGSPEGTGGEVRGKSIINQQSDFVPGGQVIFEDSFASAAPGSMPRTWKTNGSGSIVTLDGISGKWLALQEWSQYKLNSPPQYPANFTIEFDVVAATDQVRDLSPFTFGFAIDNSVGDGSAGSLNEIELEYYNGGGGTVRSDSTDYHRPHEYPLSGFANRVMHVAISVEGENMKAYLDGTKIADARLFLGNPAKYFFLKAPIDSKHDAAVLVGNFRIATLN